MNPKNLNICNSKSLAFKRESKSYKRIMSKVEGMFFIDVIGKLNA